MAHGDRDRVGTSGVHAPRRMQRAVAVGVAIAVSAVALVGVEATAPTPASASAPAPAPASAPATAGSAPPTSSATATSKRATVTAVTATSTGTRVRAAVAIRNTTSSRQSSQLAWVYLRKGGAQYVLGQVAVPSLAAGAGTTVRATIPVPRRAPAGSYTVRACTGVYAAGSCQTAATTVATRAAPAARPQTGVMLDVARAYYPVSVIEGYIDVLARDGGDYLHLHLTDDQNVGIESAALGQTLADADLHDGVYTSRVTGRPFLSAAQARTISAYATARGITIVPEVDTPGHMAAAFALLEARHGTAWVDRIRAGESELDVTVPASKALAARVYAELERTFPASRTVHIGGDEWGADVPAARRVQWLNTMAAVLGDRDVWAWNDGIDRSAVQRLDPRIRITYWSLDGDTEDRAERAERRRTRARAVDLDAAGIEQRNYNSYYLYEVPTDLDQADMDYTVADLRAHWSLRTWDGDTGARLRSPMAGAAVAIWGEDLESPPSEDLLRWSAPHIRAMIQTARS